MKDLGTLNYFLGLEVSIAADGYHVSQAKYVFDLLSCADLTDSKTAFIPLEPNVRFTPLDGTPFRDPTLYRTLVGSLVYLTVTRPDIAYVVHLVSQFISGPRTTHFAAVLHILRYIKGTLFHGLHFSSHSSLKLHACYDADWAGDPTDRRSTTGCFFLENGTLSEIKKAYKQLARKYHPDVSRWSARRSVTPERTEEYTKTIIRVHETYETLSDRQTKASYDIDMSKGLHLAFSVRKSGQNDQKSVPCLAFSNQFRLNKMGLY
ncbi:hypothetical protein RJ639_018935 [Escallonia herrerae]|uniref:J domain-containing protein n=1 Tax=Escallonia herrerae TaxID=1293975 RepID=A0AA89AJL2_9ASTE|nr:hypothetical protein RJ639_018935 [Escallonia herrerae]